MSFDRLAPHYDWMEAATAGGRLQQARTAWLEELRDCSRILSVGEGHGRFAEACARRFPDAEIVCVDASAGMLQRAQHRTEGISAHLHFVQGELPAWKPEGKFDAIVTCFFLDCFPPGQLAQIIATLASCATPQALWVVTDFAVPHRGFGRLRAQAVHALMYAFFRLATRLPASRLTPPDRLLQAGGFRLEKRRQFEWGLVQADLWRRQ